MVAGRHNLTRRALLGAGVGACAAPGAAALAAARAAGAGPDTTLFALSLSKGSPCPSAPQANGGLRQAQPERVSCDPAGSETQSAQRWARTLAAYRRAEARVAAFNAEERKLPPARRAYPACADLEERFGELDPRRLAVLRRLLRTPAPDLPRSPSSLS
jgi:hypothetical protein